MILTKSSSLASILSNDNYSVNDLHGPLHHSPESILQTINTNLRSIDSRSTAAAVTRTKLESTKPFATTPLRLIEYFKSHYLWLHSNTITRTQSIYLSIYQCTWIWAQSSAVAGEWRHDDDDLYPRQINIYFLFNWQTQPHTFIATCLCGYEWKLRTFMCLCAIFSSLLSKYIHIYITIHIYTPNIWWIVDGCIHTHIFGAGAWNNNLNAIINYTNIWIIVYRETDLHRQMNIESLYETSMTKYYTVLIQYGMKRNHDR